jgi:Domain of unknown function (DUF4105)
MKRTSAVVAESLALLYSSRSVLYFLVVAATISVCANAGETPLLSGKTIRHENRNDASQVTLTIDQLSAPTVALVTFGPGSMYWERFGHNAIIIDDPAAGTRMAYNYGAFDFEEKHFLWNFALGDMRYSLDAEPLDADVAAFTAEGRSVTVQMLNLTPTQARQLAAFLTWNAQPQNAVYRYDYFINNCSTKVRDALNRALDGTLERQLARQSAPHTYRFDAVRLISPDLWFALGGDLILGPKADSKLSLWQESFVPMVLSRALAAVTVRDANGQTRPLVSDEQVVAPGTLPPPPAAPRDFRLAFLAVGVGLASLLLWLGQGESHLYRTSFALLAVAWWLICGFTGLVLAGLWGLTAHWAIWDNENLLLFNPVCLVLPALWWRAPRIACYVAILIAVSALISPIVRALPGLYQGNLAFIALALPVHLIVAVLAWRREKRFQVLLPAAETAALGA